MAILMYCATASPMPYVPGLAVMPWPYDPSPPHITPEMLLADRCKREGITPESLALPPVLVATFQGASYRHLAARTGVTPPAGSSRRHRRCRGYCYREDPG